MTAYVWWSLGDVVLHRNDSSARYFASCISLNKFSSFLKKSTLLFCLAAQIFFFCDCDFLEDVINLLKKVFCAVKNVASVSLPGTFVPQTLHEQFEMEKWNI